MKSLTELPEWQALAEHQQDIAKQHMRDWFNHDKERFAQFSLSCSGLFLDYSRNRIQQETLNRFQKLALTIELPKKIEALFTGLPVNDTENRPALHTALRDKNHSPIMVQGENIAAFIQAAQEKMQHVVTQIHSQHWKGVTGKPIVHIVNLGIGGSHHGPFMSIHALKDFAVSHLQFHFISSIDPAHWQEVLEKIDPETTLFIISSKSFTTIETMTNARIMMQWMKDKLGEKAIQQHFIAITAAKEKALALGIIDEHIFPLWDWVGGRYSLWSAIGLPLMLMLGPKQFDEFLAGAYAMDQHFRTTPFSQNMPVILAFLSVWYINFFAASAQAIVPYSYRLRHLVPYIQQVDMESNGKSVNRQHHPISYLTGPVIFGEEGCNGQHTYHQLLHQGQYLIPVDFILLGEVQDANQDILIASGLSQAQALMRGKTYDEAYAELIQANYTVEAAQQLAVHRQIPGNRPSNILFIERMTPYHLGALLALYEHKIFTQSMIWDINPFDQWGVELGKQLIPNIMNCLHHSSSSSELDCATEGLIALYKKWQGKK